MVNDRTRRLVGEYADAVTAWIADADAPADRGQRLLRLETAMTDAAEWRAVQRVAAVHAALTGGPRLPSAAVEETDDPGLSEEERALRRDLVLIGALERLHHQDVELAHP